MVDGRVDVDRLEVEVIDNWVRLYRICGVRSREDFDGAFVSSFERAEPSRRHERRAGTIDMALSMFLRIEKLHAARRAIIDVWMPSYLVAGMRDGARTC